MEREFRINWTILVEEAVRRRHKLKLTQKQLATLAKVSTPTVSRLEQADRDIQVSSVLPILDVLGMTDSRTVVFPDENFKADLDDRINFWGQEGDKPILFRISREALEDYFSDRDRLRPEFRLQKISQADRIDRAPEESQQRKGTGWHSADSGRGRCRNRRVTRCQAIFTAFVS